MEGAGGEGFQEEEIEGALEEVGFFGRQFFGRHRLTFYTYGETTRVDCQGIQRNGEAEAAEAFRMK